MRARDAAGNAGARESATAVSVDDDAGGGTNLRRVLPARVPREVPRAGERGADVRAVRGGKRVGTVGEESRAADEGRDGVPEMLRERTPGANGGDGRARGR